MPGTQNFVAYTESRRNQREAEWMSTTSSQQDTLNEFYFTPETDCLHHVLLPAGVV